jgi:hypothetical protein
MKPIRFSATWVIAAALLFGCAEETGETASDATTDDTATDDTATSDTAADDTETDEPAKVGFEILQTLSANEIIVWLGLDITPEAFDAIEAPQGWFKNQPREGEPDASSFARSPDASNDGEFTDEVHFGHTWRHNATVIEANTPLDDQGLLRLSRVSKFHTVTFYAGRTLKVLISPEGNQYVRISRDADRVTDDPNLPNDWALVDYVTPEELTFQLPNPTDNIRADNEDSFQGPVSELNLNN